MLRPEAAAAGATHADLGGQHVRINALLPPSPAIRLPLSSSICPALTGPAKEQP
jgi:hypothetical protein